MLFFSSILFAFIYIIYLFFCVVPPKLISQSSQNELKSREGDSVILHCPVKDSGYSMKIIWKKDGKVFNAGSTPPHFEFSPDHTNIRIRKSQAADTGIYSCIASNLAGETDFETSLLVLGKTALL